MADDARLAELRGLMIAALPGLHPWGDVVDLLLPVVSAWAEQYAARRAAEELETLAFRLVAVDVKDMAVYDAIGDLRAALTPATEEKERS